MIATLSISPIEAFNSIDLRVISFLFGMLVITEGFEMSGLIEYIVLFALQRARNLNRLLLAIIFGGGFLSAILVNDTLALLMTPMVLRVTSKVGLGQNKSLLLPMAFGITTGSTITPIGNPQNLLVALDSGMATPFTEFLFYLLVPAALSLLAIFFLCRIFYGKDLANRDYQEIQKNLPHPKTAISDMPLAKLSAGTLAVLLVGFIVVEIFPVLQTIGLSLNVLALIAGIGLLILSPRRVYIFMGINWGILLFFAGMFIVMRTVWDSGIGIAILSLLPSPQLGNSIQSTASILTSSTVLSQILSNVPFVQLYSYQMSTFGFTSSNINAWVALAAGSTLAGNLTLLGAVSNVIVIDAADAKGEKSFSFFEFLKAGLAITGVTLLIFFVFLALL